MCTNNKDIFLTILRWHVRAAHLQYLCHLETDLADAEADNYRDILSFHADIAADKNDGISCELSLRIRYPTLQSIMGAKNHLSIQVKLICHVIYHSIYHGIYHVTLHVTSLWSGRDRAF
jgi:hypothetical protein